MGHVEFVQGGDHFQFDDNRVLDDQVGGIFADDEVLVIPTALTNDSPPPLAGGRGGAMTPERT